MSNMQELTENVIQWGADKGLHTADLRPQLIKLTEELGELAAGVARNDKELILDSIGDMLVVLINFGACFAADFDEADKKRIANEFLTTCLQYAWEEIQDRKGTTKDGVFVKEED